MTGVSLERPSRLDWTLVAAAAAISIVGWLIGDRTNWSDGYGYDGRLYGELATNWPQAVRGEGPVVPPGLGSYTGPELTGLDSYYAFRVFPSALAFIGLKVFGLDPSHENVVAMFALVAAVMFALAAWAWCRTADLLALGRSGKLLGAIGLLASFCVLRTGTYYPVLTDHVAYGLGALSMYLWLRGATIPLVLCVLAACFTWPLHLIAGSLLLVFPAPPVAQMRERLAEGVRERPQWRPGRFGAIVGGIVAVSGVAYLTYLQLDGQRSGQGTEQLPAFPLSVALVGAYIFLVVAFLLPRDGVAGLVKIVKGLDWCRVLLAIGVLAVVFAATSWIARRPGLEAEGLLKAAFWASTLDPGVFLVVLIAYYGALIAFLLADMPRVAADAWRLGPAMVGIVGMGLLYALTNQPREVVDVAPFLILAGVLAARRLYPLTTVSLVVFLGGALVLSRVWLPIGDISTDLSKLSDFPAQRYFMGSGAWTSPFTYALQLVGVTVVLAVLWLVARSQRSASTA